MLNKIKGLFSKKETKEQLKQEDQPQESVEEMKDELPLVNEEILLPEREFVPVHTTGFLSGVKIGEKITLSEIKKNFKIDFIDEERKIIKFSKNGIMVKCKEI